MSFKYFYFKIIFLFAFAFTIIQKSLIPGLLSDGINFSNFSPNKASNHDNLINTEIPQGIPRLNPEEKGEYVQNNNNEVKDSDQIILDSSKLSLKKIQKNRLGNYKCRFCSNFYKRKSRLVVHMRTHVRKPSLYIYTSIYFFFF